MLTRAWMGHVSPEWTIRVGHAEAGGLDPAWADADDRALVELCLSGRRDAFGVIVERHRRQVYQLCYRYVGNHEDAADLAQDAFIRAFKGLNGFKGEASLGTWLYRIAVNVCLNRLALKSASHRADRTGRANRSARGASRCGAPARRTSGGSPRRDQATAAEAACNVDPSDLS